MKITPLDGLTRYHVQSDVNPDNIYLVDLSENFGVGKCSCHQFTYRIAPLLKGAPEIRAALQSPERYRCKHIVAVRDQLGKDLTDTLVKKEVQASLPRRIGPPKQQALMNR